jgi:ABC-type microcin C transport system permease subunit YejE
MMQGDGVGDGFLQTYRGAGSLQWTLSALSQFFVYSFVVFFIYSVLNVFVTILQESFLRVRKHIHSELQQRRQLKVQVLELSLLPNAALSSALLLPFILGHSVATCASSESSRAGSKFWG